MKASGRPATLGLDLGTGSVKALVLDDNGAALAVASAPVPVHAPLPGWAESAPLDWWSSVKAAVGEVLARTSAPIMAVGLAGQMHGVVMARSDGTALRPAIISLDSRAKSDLAAYRSLPPPLLASLGNPLVPGMAGPLLRWLARNEPAVVGRADWALQPKDWVRLRLVGEAGTEPSDASGTLLFDLERNTWSLPVVAALGLRSALLPPLGQSSAVAGTLLGAPAKELGLPEGTPVAFGCADTAAALVGAGLYDPAAVQLTVGSAAQVVALRLSPEPDPHLRYHLFASAVEGRWYALAAVQAAGVVLSWVLRALQATWEEAYEMLEAVPAGARGVIFLPHLAGARSPSMNSAARAGFWGLELRHDRADMVRAAFEGVAFSVAEAAAALPEFAPASTVHLAGGGTLHPSWRQLLCDLLDKHLSIVEVPDTSARGAALVAARSIGMASELGQERSSAGQVAPRSGEHERLAGAFERWKQIALTSMQPPFVPDPEPLHGEPGGRW